MEKVKKYTQDSAGRQKFLYLLTIGNKISKPIWEGVYSTPEEANHYKCYVATTARKFKKTAGVLVYREAIDEQGETYWDFYTSCEVETGCSIPVVYDTTRSINSI